MKSKTGFLFLILMLFFLNSYSQPGTAEEPARFVGKLSMEFDRPDGALPPVIGAQSYQVIRSVKSDKRLGDGLGFTFHHHPMLTHWNNEFYVLCNACPQHEERGWTEILLTKSANGMNWGKPEIIFPHVIYKGEPTFCNHRMGFYIGPSGRLYASTAYFPQSEMPPQTGSEDTGKKYFGVVVREIKEDGSYGKIYFIAKNSSLYPEEDFPFPYFEESDDKEFLKDCQSLRNDKLITLHWWEQMRPENFDFPQSLVRQIKNGDRKFAKAISYYHRPDGVVVAFWKKGKSAISYDDGETWTEVVNLKTFSDGYAKVWAQQTEDGKFAASWRPLGEGSWGRYPMLWATSDDGIIYDNAMHVNGEVTRRYEGGSKSIGPCNYQRGLYENGADIPGDDVWVVYSMSKEDIWISRIPVPMSKSSENSQNQNFDDAGSVLDLKDWNVFSPRWAPVSVESFPSEENQSLCFSDKDPFDYAKAFKVFRESQGNLSINFRVLARQNDHGRFEIDLGNLNNLAPVRIAFTPTGEVEVDHWKMTTPLTRYFPDQWNNVNIKINLKENSFIVSVNGEVSDELIFNSRPVDMLDRITFRTGMFRGISINPVPPEKDVPLEKEAKFYLDDVIFDFDN